MPSARILPALLPVLALALALPACATRRSVERPAAPSLPRPCGTISMVNEEFGFVLIDSPEGLAPGTRLKAFAPQGERETGALLVGAEQARPFFTAEITGGTPRPGDWVARLPEKPEAPAPSAGPAPAPPAEANR